MTAPMRSTPAYQSLHAKLVQEVRSEPVEAAETQDAGQHVFGLVSAAMSLRTLPDNALLIFLTNRQIRAEIRARKRKAA